MKKSWSRKELEAQVKELQNDLANAMEQARLWGSTAERINGHIGGLQNMLKVEPEKTEEETDG